MLFVGYCSICPDTLLRQVSGTVRGEEVSHKDRVDLMSVHTLVLTLAGLSLGIVYPMNLYKFLFSMFFSISLACIMIIQESRCHYMYIHTGLSKKLDKEQFNSHPCRRNTWYSVKYFEELALHSVHGNNMAKTNILDDNWRFTMLPIFRW